MAFLSKGENPWKRLIGLVNTPTFVHMGAKLSVSFLLSNYSNSHTLCSMYVFEQVT